MNCAISDLRNTLAESQLILFDIKNGAGNGNGWPAKMSVGRNPIQVDRGGRPYPSPDWQACRLSLVLR